MEKKEGKNKRVGPCCTLYMGHQGEEGVFVYVCVLFPAARTINRSIDRFP